MANPPTRPSGNSAIIGSVLLVVALLAVVLVWQSSNEDRLRSGQRAGVQQRSDQQQVMCALWAALRSDHTDQLPASMVQAADNVCAMVSTPAPSGR